MKLILLLLASFLSFVPGVFSQSGDAEFIFEVDGRLRVYYLYLPEKLPENSPLVFVLHGYGGSAKEIIEYFGMNKVADENGFAVCYPQGNFGEDKKNSWNAAYSNDDVDDVKFLSKLAAFLHTKYKLSEAHTFCTGISNGGDMCYVMACNAPNVFSAVAPVAGCMMESTYKHCNPRAAVPIFEMHGTDDDITLWMGDVNYSAKYGAYLGTRKVIDFWIKNNECYQSKQELLPDTNQEDKSYVVAEKYSGSGLKQQVWLYSIIGGKHDLPGSSGNMDMDGATEIWNFFEQFIIN